MRSPSRDAVRSGLSSISEAEQIEYERSIIRKREAARAQHSARAGVGNTVRRTTQSQPLFRSGSRGNKTPATSQPGHGMNDLAFESAQTRQRGASREELSRKATL